MNPSGDEASVGEEARECAKCGAILPSGDEGLCEVCGTAFGYRTSVMPIVTAAAIAQARGPEAAGPSARPAPSLVPARRSGPPARVLLVALGAVVLVLIAVLVAILAT